MKCNSNIGLHSSLSDLCPSLFVGTSIPLRLPLLIQRKANLTLVWMGRGRVFAGLRLTRLVTEKCTTE